MGLHGANAPTPFPLLRAVFTDQITHPYEEPTTNPYDTVPTRCRCLMEAFNSTGSDSNATDAVTALYGSKVIDCSGIATLARTQ